MVPVLGPHPINQEELRTAFSPSNGWKVAAIEPDRIQTRYHDHDAPAWFATIRLRDSLHMHPAIPELRYRN